MCPNSLFFHGPMNGEKSLKGFEDSLQRMPVRTTIESVKEFQTVLLNNPNWVILKFSATWCVPCKRAAPIVDPWLEKVQEQDYSLFLLDIDENFELYGYLKSKKRVQGIPALLAYKKGNTDIIPDLFVSGTDPSHINTFFQSLLHPSV